MSDDTSMKMSSGMANGREEPRDEFNEDHDMLGGNQRDDPRKNWLHRNAKKWGLNKKGLIIILVLAALALVFFIAFIVTLFVALIEPEEPPPPPVCHTPECLRTAARVHESMNSSSDPCVDFWDYACGGWLKLNPVPETKSKWGVREKLLYQERDALRRLVITQPHPKTADSTLPWKLWHFLDSCLDLERIDNDGIRHFTRIIETLGGWEVLKSYRKNSWQKNIVLRTLHAEYGAQPYFKVDVVPDPYDPIAHIVRISPGGLSLPSKNLYFDRGHDDPLIVEFKRYLKDAVQILGAIGPDAEQFAQDIFHYEKRIAERTPNEDVYQHPANTTHKVTLKYLQERSTQVPWKEVLKTVYPNSGIGENTEVLVTSLEYATEVSKLMTTSDDDVVNNYMMWHLLKVFLPYLTEKYREVHELYNRRITGNQEPEPRWDTCMETTTDVFGYGLGALYSRENTGKGPTEQMVEKMFSQLKTTLAADIKYSPGFLAEMRKQSLEKVETMRLSLGYPAKMLEDKYLNDFYSQITVQKKDWFRNMINAAFFKRRQQEQTLLKRQEERRWMPALLANKVTYVPTANMLVVPEFLLQSPFFHISAPLATIWGGLGVDMAYAMAESVGSKGIYYDMDGVFSSEDVTLNRTLEYMKDQWECISEAFLRRPINEEEKVVTRTTYSSLSFLAGIRQAYKSFFEMLGDATPPLNPTLEESSLEQLFFLSLGQSMCSDARALQKDLDKATSYVLNNKSRLKGSLAQMPKFLKAFKCSDRSPMSLSRKCGRVI